MADDRPSNHNGEPDGSADLNRPRRTPPTLDLAATEVSHAAPDIAAEPVADEPPPAHDPVSDSPPRPSRTGAIVAGALAGTAATALLLGLVWVADRPIGASSSSDPAPMSLAPPTTAMLDDLSSRLAKIEARPAPVAPPAPPAAAAPDLSPITARIAALEAGMTALREETTAARTRSEQMLAAIDALKSAPPPSPPPAPAAPVDLAPLDAKIAQLETGLRAQATAAAQASAKPADDAPLRRVVSAALLDQQVRRSEPYAAALIAAKPLASDVQKLAPLDAFAATGVPSVTALSQELLTLLPKLTPATAATTGTGLMDKLQAGAARLVKIERTDAVAGNSASAVASRAAAAARQNDIATASRELKTLAPTDRAAVQPWLDKVEARNAALAAAQQFSADAMTALSKPAP